MRAAERAAFEERRQRGLAARHAAKLAYWAARRRQEEETLEPIDNRIDPDPPEPEAA